MGTRAVVFGNPPFRFLAEHLAADTGFLEDAQLILKLDQDEYLRLATQLAKSDTFLSHSDLVNIVDEALGEGSDRIASIIYRIGGIVHDAEMDALDAMDALSKAIEEKADSLEPGDRRMLTERLRKLVAEPIGIAKQYELATDDLLRALIDAGANPRPSLLCSVELAHFEPSQHPVLLPLLWQYILDHRNSNDRDELGAVGSAIRKYIAIMPMDRMGDLAALLETGHRSPLPIDLEIEAAKMIYRNYEVHPPVVADPHPMLAQRLLEMVHAYINPRILLRDKHSAATSLAIEAIVAMRSPLAEQAWQAAVACPYRWFSELVSDDLDELDARWSTKSPDSAAWLRALRNHVFAHV